MPKVSKRKLSDQRERDSADQLDAAILAMNAGDFRPRLKEYASLPPTQLIDAWADTVRGVEVDFTNRTDVGSDVAGLFRMRDKPDGMTRRQALRHWVRAHNRGGADGKPPVEIERYLRGAEWFDWFGLRCRVHPPAAVG